MEIRKIVTTVEETLNDGARRMDSSPRRVVASAVVANPLAEGLDDDLEPLMVIGEELGALLMDRALAAVDGRADLVTGYGKAVLVGTDGLLEHGAAIIHPRFGKQVRKRLTSPGAAVMASAKKLSATGSSLLVPIAGTEDPWDATHFDAVEVTCSDAPLPAEIFVALALGIGGRAGNRVSIDTASAPVQQT